jgi:hypothetical protein
MAQFVPQFDPETLIVLQKALDAAWAHLPDDCKSEARKAELAQLMIQLSTDGALRRLRFLAGSIRE